jgi:hypothetical protein
VSDFISCFGKCVLAEEVWKHKNMTPDAVIGVLFEILVCLWPGIVRFSVLAANRLGYQK